ncbi:MAG: hypothetical protein ACMG6H_07860 [Acidobacteriota bacterium]
MEREPKMKVVGGRNLPSHWERFDRLQRTAQALLGRPISPKGVFRFKTFEEFNEWKDALRYQDQPKKTIS